ncbi:MAG: F0F1 ATP synthase subunit gamma, partial [Anaerolineae bacterium]|nr:F0F1 ATP synthase subunit gamma [Anaerolineae bacterium]
IRRESQAFRTALVLVIASERGLCGGYNDTALEGAERLIAQQQLQSEQVFVATLGAQASVHFERAGRELYTSYAMPVTRVPSAELIREIAESLLAPFYQGEMDAIFVIHVPYRLGLTMPPVLQRWVPVEPSMLPGRSTQWPPPILETKAETLFELTMHEWIYSRFYQFVMAASASEQSARYRAMENASSNIQRIISELTLSYHSARQHAITMEMLDLVAASGMLRGPEERLS